MAMLVGIGYRKRHGKDVVADYLVDKHGFKKLSWAFLLKEGVNKWHGWDDRHSYGDLKEVVDPYWGYSPRTAYQKIGTDLMRNRWRDTFWVDCALRQIKELMAQGQSVVVPDTRFPNEAKAVLEMDGGELWRIDRPSMPEPNPAPTGLIARVKRRVLGKKWLDQFDHASETGLTSWPTWTEILVNDGTITDLEAKTEALFNRTVPIL